MTLEKLKEHLVRSVDERNCWRTSCILLRHSTRPVTCSLNVCGGMNTKNIIQQHPDLDRKLSLMKYRGIAPQLPKARDAETLITFLTIEDNNLNIHCNPTIKIDKVHTLQC